MVGVAGTTPASASDVVGSNDVVAEDSPDAAIGGEPTEVAPAVPEDQADIAATAGYVVFNHTDTATATSYWETPHQNISAAQARRPATLRIKVLAKPSDKLVFAQVCMWRNNLRQETCSKGLTFRNEGTYTVNVGAPVTWWKKGGWTWGPAFNPVRIMLKEGGVKGNLLMSKRCGSYCYRGGDLGRHVPIKMTGTLTLN